MARNKEETQNGWPAGESERRELELAAIVHWDQDLKKIQQTVRKRAGLWTMEDRYGKRGEDAENYDEEGRARQKAPESDVDF